MKRYCQTTSCLIIYLLSLLSLCLPSNTYSEPYRKETIKIHDTGWTGIMRGFHVALSKMVFKASEEDFGKVELTFVKQEMSQRRKYKSLNDGSFLHLEYTTVKVPPMSAYAGIDQFSCDTHKGILGLRKILVRDGNVTLRDFQDRNTFSTLSVGQGYDWPDKEVYRRIGLPLVEGMNIDSLLAMLQVGRFDYLPLSVIEVNAVLEQHSLNSQFIKPLENFYIFYPIPIYCSFHKTGNTSERFRYGLEKIKNNGELDTLYAHYFGDYTDKLADDEVDIYVFTNPLLNEQENKQYIKEFTLQTKQHSSRMHFLGELTDINCSDNSSFSDCLMQE